MARFCTHCGAQLDEEGKCPSCDVKAESAGAKVPSSSDGASSVATVVAPVQENQTDAVASTPCSEERQPQQGGWQPQQGAQPQQAWKNKNVARAPQPKAPGPIPFPEMAVKWMPGIAFGVLALLGLLELMISLTMWFARPLQVIFSLFRLVAYAGVTYSLFIWCKMKRFPEQMQAAVLDSCVVFSIVTVGSLLGIFTGYSVGYLPEAGLAILAIAGYRFFSDRVDRSISLVLGCVVAARFLFSFLNAGMMAYGLWILVGLLQIAVFAVAAVSFLRHRS